MSADEKAAVDVVGTLRDGQNGYDSAIERLGEEAPADVLDHLRAISAERKQFADRIVALGGKYGDDVQEDGSVAASLHRGWINLKDKLTGADAGAVLASCAKGDEHAISVYEDALGKDDLSPNFRRILEGQLQEIRQNHAEIERLAEAH